MITKKDFLTKGSFINEQKEGNSDYTEMISLLLHSRTQAHTLHLQTESYPEHMALNAYYTGIGDLVDGLVESFQGKIRFVSVMYVFVFLNVKLQTSFLQNLHC